MAYQACRHRQIRLDSKYRYTYNQPPMRLYSPGDILQEHKLCMF